jgi:hypothetical protein
MQQTSAGLRRRTQWKPLRKSLLDGGLVGTQKVAEQLRTVVISIIDEFAADRAALVVI